MRASADNQYDSHAWTYGANPYLPRSADTKPTGHSYPHHPQPPPPEPALESVLTPDVIAAITRALGPGASLPSSLRPSTTKYFSNTITDTTSDLPISVIKELKTGFKNYIPLALCTHKACYSATRSTDTFDTEIGWTDKGEMKLKQKAMTAAKDHYLTTDDFTEVRENFVRGMRKYLVMGDDVEPGGDLASACADMFANFFSVIAARPDYTRDWPSYRGYIVESYTSWVGRRDDSYGLIFDEHLFYKHKVTNLVPVIMEQLRQSSTSGAAGNTGGRGGPGPRGRGRGNGNRGGYQAQGFFPSSNAPYTPKCYLCGGAHYHKEHQGTATRLVVNDQGKWVDKQLGNKTVCISFNLSSAGCKRGTTCTYNHSCSLCGDLSHGCAKCTA